MCAGGGTGPTGSRSSSRAAPAPYLPSEGDVDRPRLTYGLPRRVTKNSSCRALPERGAFSAPALDVAASNGSGRRARDRPAA